MEQYAVDASAIRCPMLVCSAEDDLIGRTADRLYSAIRTPKARMHFTVSEGAGGHRQSVSGDR